MHFKEKIRSTVCYYDERHYQKSLRLHQEDRRLILFVFITLDAVSIESYDIIVISGEDIISSAFILLVAKFFRQTRLTMSRSVIIPSGRFSLSITITEPTFLFFIRTATSYADFPVSEVIVTISLFDAISLTVLTRKLSRKLLF